MGRETRSPAAAWRLRIERIRGTSGRTQRVGKKFRYSAVSDDTREIYPEKDNRADLPRRVVMVDDEDRLTSRRKRARKRNGRWNLPTGSTVITTAH